MNHRKQGDTKPGKQEIMEKNLKITTLLGGTKSHELAFGEFQVTTRNGYDEFTASFFTVRPFSEDSFDSTEYIQNMLDDCYDDATKYQLCVQHSCAPDELASCMNINVTDPRDLKDCSLYSEEIDVDGTSWYFESGSCGQLNLTDEMSDESEDIFDKDTCKRLMNIWKARHLQKVQSGDWDAINALYNAANHYTEQDEQEWIRQYIKDYEYDF